LYNGVAREYIHHMGCKERKRKKLGPARFMILLGLILAATIALLSFSFSTPFSSSVVVQPSHQEVAHSHDCNCKEIDCSFDH